MTVLKNVGGIDPIVRQNLQALERAMPEPTDTTVIEGDVAALQADLTALQGDVTLLDADLTTVEGDLAAHQGAADPHTQYVEVGEAAVLGRAVPDADFYASGYTGYGTPIFSAVGAPQNVVVAAGAMVLAPVMLDEPSSGRLVFHVAATSLTAGQSVYIGTYAQEPSRGLLPTSTPQWSQAVVLGTTTGAVGVTMSSARDWAPNQWAFLMNPTGNSGSVTILGAQPSGVTRVATTVALAYRTGCLGRSSIASSTPDDLTSIPLMGATGATGDRLVAQQLGPMFCVGD